MSAIAPDQEDDNLLFSVLTESQNSESSGDDQIPTNQNIPQQDQSTGNQGCSVRPHTISPSTQSSPAVHLYDSDDNPSARRPQRISGCPQHDGMGMDVFATLENSSALEPEVNIHTLDPPAPIKKPKKRKRVQDSQEVVPPPQNDLQPDAPLTMEQWMTHQRKVDSRFEELALAFQKTKKRLQKQKARAKAQQQEQQITIQQLQESLDRTTSGIKTYIQEKEGEEVVTTTKLFKTLKKYIPDLIQEVKQDKTRGCPSATTSRKLRLAPDITDSWLQPPTPPQGSEIGFFPLKQEFPTADKFLVPKDPESPASETPNWPNPLPFSFSNESLQNFLTSPSLVQNNKVQLDIEAFEPSEISVDKTDNWQVVDAHSRKILVENLVVDQVMEKTIARLKQTQTLLDQNPEAPVKWSRELDIYHSLLETAFAANLRGRHMTSALLVSNKLKARTKILARCSGPDFSKKIMKNSSFSSPSLFGPAPDVLKLKIRESLGNRDRDFVIRPRNSFRTSSRARGNLRSNFYDRWRPGRNSNSKFSRNLSSRVSSSYYTNPSAASYFPRNSSTSSRQDASSFRPNRGSRGRPRTSAPRGRSQRSRNNRR